LIIILLSRLVLVFALVDRNYAYIRIFDYSSRVPPCYTYDYCFVIVIYLPLNIYPFLSRFLV